MKNYADLGGCFPSRPSASVDNTLLDLLNSLYPTQPHPLIAKYNIKKNVLADQGSRQASPSSIFHIKKNPKKNSLYLIDNVFSTKVLIGEQ